MLGTTTYAMRTRSGFRKITRTATRPSTKGEAGNQSVVEESADWFERKLQQIDRRLSEIRANFTEESDLESAS